MNAEALREARKSLDIVAEDLERVAERLERKTESERLELVGIAEIAELTGLRPETVTARKQRGRLPKPYAELKMGSVWLREHITEWWALEQ